MTVSSTSEARSSPLPATNLLSEIILLLRPQEVQPKVIMGAGKWGVRYGPHEHAGFTLMLEGSCFLDVENVGALQLNAGDFLLLPRTYAFTMASHADVKPKLVNATPANEVRHGPPSESITVRMVGGYFRFDNANTQLLLSLLPPVIHVKAEQEGAARLQTLSQLIDDEANARRPGREPMLERLVELALIEAVRCRAARPASVDLTSAKSRTPEAATAPPPKAQERGLLSGLADPALARPLRSIHHDLARRWTVEELARTAGMSRAVFAERFTRKVGIPPMQYLLEWRMAKAKELLTKEHPPLAEVAEKIGYQSASAFSTAFTKFNGCSPSEYARFGRTSATL